MRAARKCADVNQSDGCELTAQEKGTTRGGIQHTGTPQAEASPVSAAAFPHSAFPERVKPTFLCAPQTKKAAKTWPKQPQTEDSNTGAATGRPRPYKRGLFYAVKHITVDSMTPS